MNATHSWQFHMQRNAGKGGRVDRDGDMCDHVRPCWTFDRMQSAEMEVDVGGRGLGDPG